MFSGRRRNAATDGVIALMFHKNGSVASSIPAFLAEHAVANEPAATARGRLM
jgi:hypothetical protein